MNITHCDGCGKRIVKEEGSVWVGTGSTPLSACVFCEKCGKPVVKFLQKTKAGVFHRRKASK